MENIFYRARRKSCRIVTNMSMKLPIRPNNNPFAIHFEEPKRRSVTSNRMKAIKDSKKGTRCIILGSAPSVMEMDLRVMAGDYILALNKSYLLKEQIGRNPDATIVTNIYAAAEYGHELCEAASEHVFVSASAAGALKEMPGNLIIFSQWDSPNMDHGFFQFNALRPLYQSGTVAHTALQIAVWMGFDEIIMVGVDLSFTTDSGHFYNSSSGEQNRTRTASKQNSDRMIAGLLSADMTLRARGGPSIRRIAAPGSRNPLSVIEMSEMCHACF